MRKKIRFFNVWILNFYSFNVGEGKDVAEEITGL